MVCFLFKYMQPVGGFGRLYIKMSLQINKSRISIKKHHMKKISILIIGLMILGVSACRKVTNEYYTTPNQTIFTTVAANSWVKSTNGADETYSADIPFANTDIYQNGFDGVLVYLSYDGGTDNTNSTWEPISQTYEGLSYRYVVTQQKITIQVQPSSGTGAFTNPPGSVRAKVVMILSEQ